MSVSEEQNRRKAVEEPADITRGSYRTVVGRAFAARESNLRLAPDFFERTVIEIQEQSTISRCASQAPSEHARKQSEALEELAEATAGTHEDILGSRLQDSRK